MGVSGGCQSTKGEPGDARPALFLPGRGDKIPPGKDARLDRAIHLQEANVMNEATELVEYGVPIDPQLMVTPPDATELELEPGHPGLGDEDYIRRRKELFALCRKHRLEGLGPPFINYTPEE